MRRTQQLLPGGIVEQPRRHGFLAVLGRIDDVGLGRDRGQGAVDDVGASGHEWIRSSTGELAGEWGMWLAPLVCIEATMPQLKRFALLLRAENLSTGGWVAQSRGSKPQASPQ